MYTDGTLSHSARKYWVDFMRALTIVLVVFSHVDDHRFTLYLSAARLPMFFFISGLLVSRTDLSGPFFNYVRKYVRSLVIPFYVFGIAAYPLWYAKNLFVPTAAFIRDGALAPLGGLLYGISGPHQWMTHNMPLWFLTCLFMVHLIFWCIRQLVTTPVQTLLVSVVVGLAGFLLLRLLPFRLPWNLEIAMAAVVFYALGFLSKTLNIADALSSPVISAVVFPVALGGCVIAALVNGPIHIGGGVLRRPELYYLGGLAGIVSCIIVAIRMPRLELVSIIAKNTLAILAMHAPVLVVLRMTVNRTLNLGIEPYSSSWLYSISATSAAIGICVMVSVPMRAYAPWMLGLRPVNESLSRRAVAPM